MKITVTDTQTSIPAAGTGRRQLILRNTGSSTVYLGWESTMVATDNANQGVPLLADETISFGGPDLDLRGALYLVCASTESTTVNYTQRG